MPLKRKQIYLDATSDNTLKKLAKETGLSTAEHIRRAVKRYVDQYNQTRAGSVSDPLLDLIGIWMILTLRKMAPFTTILGDVATAECQAMWDRVHGGAAGICTSRQMEVR